jgi:hypothetical protein
MKMTTRITDKNPMMGQVLNSVAQLLIKLKDSSENWHLSPIWGHTQVHKPFNF